MVLVELVLLGVFVVVLAKSAEVVVEGALKLAAYFRVSSIAIGILLIALSTSLPEFAVAISSAASGNGAVSAGNVFGSNISNILIIFGIGAILYGVKIPKENLPEVGGILLLTTIISAYIIMSSLVFNRALGWVEGLLLLAIFVAYAYQCTRGCKVPEKAATPYNSKKNIGAERKKAFYAFVYFVIGVILVMISSEIVVENAVSIAKSLGLAESLIGATIIAIGTSLPELSVDLQALRKKQYGLAVGDALGSNVMNLTLVLGTGAVLNEISVNIAVFIAALLFAIVANVVLLYFAALRKTIGRFSGILFLLTYVLFTITILGLQAKAVG